MTAVVLHAAPTDALPGADDPRALTAVQRDALREVANIGAGHAATALSQMTGSSIMISVPTVQVARLDAVGPQLAPGEDPVAAVLMDIMGDLTGRTLLVFPKATVMRVAERMLRRPPGSSVALGALERSAVMEAGNILSGAYLNALADFMGLLLLPSPPRLAVDAVSAVVTPEFLVRDVAERLRGFFLLLPDPASLRAILRATRLA